MRKACESLRLLDDSGCHIDSLSINTSTVEFLKGDIASKFAAILREYELDAERIDIEVTERYMLEHDPVSESELKELRRMGHTICVDDFGTGYSSLSWTSAGGTEVICCFNKACSEQVLPDAIDEHSAGQRMPVVR